MDDQQLRERTIRQVQDAVCQMFGLSTEELETASRSRDVALPRQVAMYLTKWDLTPPAGLDADHQAIYDRLNGLSGSDFDKAYMTAVAQDHHKALDAFTTEAQSTQDPQFKAAVSKGKTVVAGHTTMADNLQSKM